MSRRKRYTRNFGRALPEPLPSSVEWVRFEHADLRDGVFSYLDAATDKLPRRAAAELTRLRRWFNQHLDAPPESVEIERERFWFRAEAMEYVGRGRRMAELLGRAGYPIVERRTRRVPGRVRWQDAHQLAVLVEEPRP